MPDLRRCDWFAELDEWHAKDLEFGKWCGPLENPLRGRFILSRVCDQRSSFGGHAGCSDRVRWLLSRDAGRWRAIAHISLADTKGEFAGMFMYISQKLVMTHRRLWSRRLNTRFGNWIRCCSSARWSGSNQHTHEGRGIWRGWECFAAEMDGPRWYLRHRPRWLQRFGLKFY